MHFGHNVAPQNTRFHHVGFFHRAKFLTALHRHLERSTCTALNLSFGITLRVDANTHVVFDMDAPWFAKVNARRQFAHDHDVEAGHQFFFQRREIGQRVETLRWAQVGKEVHFFAQAQQAPLWLDRKVKIIIRRTADSTEQNCVYFLCFCHRVIVQRDAVFVICRTADKILRHVKRNIALVAEPSDDPFDLIHDFGADAVTGEDQ